jgi:plasmid stabilization system protein ParE
VTLSVELRPQAERDLKRFERFLLKMSAPAAQRRLTWLRAEIRALADQPYASGQGRG